MSPSSPPREGEGPSKALPGGRGDGGDGAYKDLALSIPGGGASSPTVSALSSRASSIATQERGGVGGGGSRGLSSDHRDSGFDGDVDTSNPAREQSCASSMTTVTAPGDAGSPELASPGPGKLSVLFRRASAASQLPPDTAVQDSDGDDVAMKGAEDGFDGGQTVNGDGGERSGGTGTSRVEGEDVAAAGDGGEGGSIDTSSIGTSAGLTAGGGRRGPSRRDLGTVQQCPQAQPRGRGSDKDRECTRWGGRREAGSGSASSTGTGVSSSSQGVTAGKVCRQRKKVDKSGGNSGEGLGDKQEGAVMKKKELYPTSGESVIVEFI